MTEFQRKFFKNDKAFGALFKLIKSRHRVANHTAKVLFDNRHIKDFCEIARHFVLMEGNPPLYIHYDVCSWYDPNGALVRIETIGIYDNFLEYESARISQLHAAKNSDIQNIN